MQPRPRKKRVLIADTSQEPRRNTRVMLSNLRDVEVVAIALDGTQAIEMARLHKPDVVLLDINMSKVNGLNTYRQILKENPRTPCILVSAEHHAETFETAKTLGILNYLIKPFTEQELDAALLEVIQRLQRDEVGEAVTAAEKIKEEGSRPRQLAEKYVRTQHTDEAAVKVPGEAIHMPNSELRWMQTLAMIYIVRQRWGKLKALAEILE